MKDKNKHLDPEGFKKQTFQNTESQESETGNNQVSEAFKKRIKFDELLCNISTSFINSPVNEIETQVRRVLGTLGEFMGVDRSYIIEFDENRLAMILTSEWTAEGIEPTSDTYPTLPTETFPWFMNRITGGETVVLQLSDEFPEEAVNERAFLLDEHVKSIICVPIYSGSEVWGFVGFDAVRSEHRWPSEIIPQMKLIGEIIANALNRKQREESLQRAFSEVKQLKDQLNEENIYLREELKQHHDIKEIIGHSAPLKKVLRKVDQVASTDATVLLLGETGTGKELFARAIHSLSPRNDRPLVRVNCAALPANLIESELFGHEKGAFTGATSRKAGRFELANCGTLFLDEIGELPVELQVKLLRVLQEGEFERVGGAKTLSANVRVVAATNRDLDKAVQEGSFRTDLFYRLNVFPISIPPLRERVEDIPLLVRSFMTRSNKRLGGKIDRVPHRVIEVLQEYPWPGNIRELENVIERAVIMTQGTTLQLEDRLTSPQSLDSKTFQRKTLEEVEREYIIQVLERTRWRISGEGGAARLLGMNPATLRSRMKKLGIRQL